MAALEAKRTNLSQHVETPLHRRVAKGEPVGPINHLDRASNRSQKCQHLFFGQGQAKRMALGGVVEKFDTSFDGACSVAGKLERHRKRQAGVCLTQTLSGGVERLVNPGAPAPVKSVEKPLQPVGSKLGTATHRTQSFNQGQGPHPFRPGSGVGQCHRSPHRVGNEVNRGERKLLDRGLDVDQVLAEVVVRTAGQMGRPPVPPKIESHLPPAEWKRRAEGVERMGLFEPTMQQKH